MRIRLAIALGCIPLALAIVGVVLLAQSWSLQDSVYHAENELMKILEYGQKLHNDAVRIQLVLWKRRGEASPSIDELISLTEDADHTLAELELIPDLQPAAPLLARIKRELEGFKQLTSAVVTIKDRDQSRALLVQLLDSSDRIDRLLAELDAYTREHGHDALTRPYEEARLLVALLVGALTGLVVLSAGITVNVARGVGRPIAVLMEATRQLSEHNLAHRVDERLPGEFGHLAHHFNRMAEGLMQADQRRLEAIRQLVVTVEHEMRNSLASIQGAAELLRSGRANTADELERIRGQILAQVAHITAVLASLERLQRLTSTEYVRGVRMLSLGEDDERDRA